MGIASKIGTTVAPDKLVGRRLGIIAVLPQLLDTAQANGVHLDIVSRSIDDTGDGVINLNINHIEMDRDGSNSEQDAYLRLTHARRKEVIDSCCQKLEKDLIAFFEEMTPLKIS